MTVYLYQIETGRSYFYQAKDLENEISAIKLPEGYDSI